MTKLSIKADHLSSLVERAIIKAGDEGITANKLMKTLKVGLSCTRRHIASLEAAGRIYRVRRTNANAGGVYFTFHSGSQQAACTVNGPARRDPLVAYLFGEAK